MQIPLQVSFHGLDRSEALESKVREHVAKLEEFCDRVTSCHVVLEKPHRHHRHGNMYHVRVRVSVPRRELIVDQEPALDHAHEDPYVTVRDAFRAMRRQLEDYVREIRGDVKTHARPATGRAQEPAPEEASSGESRLVPIRRLPESARPSKESPAGDGGHVPEEAVRVRAYERWEAAGRPLGDGVQFWLEAERELQSSL